MAMDDETRQIVIAASILGALAVVLFIGIAYGHGICGCSPGFRSRWEWGKLWDALPFTHVLSRVRDHQRRASVTGIDNNEKVVHVAVDNRSPFVGGRVLPPGLRPGSQGASSRSQRALAVEQGASIRALATLRPEQLDLFGRQRSGSAPPAAVIPIGSSVSAKRPGSAHSIGASSGVDFDASSGSFRGVTAFATPTAGVAAQQPTRDRSAARVVLHHVHTQRRASALERLGQSGGHLPGAASSLNNKSSLAGTGGLGDTDASLDKRIAMAEMLRSANATVSAALDRVTVSAYVRPATTVGGARGHILSTINPLVAAGSSSSSESVGGRTRYSGLRVITSENQPLPRARPRPVTANLGDTLQRTAIGYKEAKLRPVDSGNAYSAAGSLRRMDHARPATALTSTRQLQPAAAAAAALNNTFSARALDTVVHDFIPADRRAAGTLRSTSTAAAAITTRPQTAADQRYQATAGGAAAAAAIAVSARAAATQRIALARIYANQDLGAVIDAGSRGSATGAFCPIDVDD